MHGLANVQKGVQNDGVLGGLLLMPRRHLEITVKAMSTETTESTDLVLIYDTYVRSSKLSGWHLTWPRSPAMGNDLVFS